MIKKILCPRCGKDCTNTRNRESFINNKGAITDYIPYIEGRIFSCYCSNCSLDFADSIYFHKHKYTFADYKAELTEDEIKRQGEDNLMYQFKRLIYHCEVEAERKLLKICRPHLTREEKKAKAKARIIKKNLEAKEII